MALLEAIPGPADAISVPSLGELGASPVLELMGHSNRNGGYFSGKPLYVKFPRAVGSKEQGP